MSYLALYRKYRPTCFDDVYDQEEIVTVIKNAIIHNKISHAYLFSGPRGTGKTTIAKIIARLVNCEHLENGNPCGKCYNCLHFLNSNDIVEIDAASNNGVDEIREIRDKINLVPSNAKYKVYIIDEVHMLTTQAFNALLKTLEEPPSHVIFILATTEPHKIPLTITSRCQKFRFKKIDDNKVVDRLKEISELENINCEEDAFFEIARLSDGCMRDAINLLDQLVAYSNGSITLNDIYRVNGSVSYSDINLLLSAISCNDKVKIIEFIDYFEKNGKEISKFIEEFIIYIKDIILFKNAGYLTSISLKNDCIKEISDSLLINNFYDLIDVLNDIFNSIKSSSHGSILFMVSILNFASKVTDCNCSDISSNNNVNKDSFLGNQNISREIISNNSKIKSLINEVDSTENNEKIEGERFIIDVDGRVNNTLASASKSVLNEFKSKWVMLENYLLSDNYSMVAGLLKDSTIVAASMEYVIVVNKLSSVVDRININIEIVQELFEKIVDSKVFVVSVSSDEWNSIKKKYIDDIKNGIKYNIIELKEEKKISNTPVDDLIQLVGDSVIEYK